MVSWWWVLFLLLGVCWAQCYDDADCVPSTTLCQMAACVEGVCEDVAMPDDTPCDDADACTLDTTCQNAQCVGAHVMCDDHNPCTRDLCYPADGCAFEAIANDTPCEDGDACTQDDVCVGGECEAGPVMECVADNGCTVGECVAGVCLQLAVVCEDTGDPLTIGVCNPGRGQCEAVVKRTLLHEEDTLPWEIVVYLAFGGIVLFLVPTIGCLLWSIYALNKARVVYAKQDAAVTTSVDSAGRAGRRGHQRL